jgi:hypothetical protein
MSRVTMRTKKGMGEQGAGVQIEPTEGRYLLAAGPHLAAADSIPLKRVFHTSVTRQSGESRSLAPSTFWAGVA